MGTAAGNFNGSAANNALTGNAGTNTLQGYDGNDSLNGGAGADKMVGGDGDDAYWVEDDEDLIVEAENSGFDRLFSVISVDLDNPSNAFVNLESVTLQGTGNLYAYGSSANNVLIGNSGDNILGGRAGSDSLAGGGGEDTFRFVKGYDQEVITDFEDNIDTIRMLSFGVANFTQAKTYATQSGANVIFDFGAGDILTVRNTTINALADDVVFV